jgi:hypothetical protein
MNTDLDIFTLANIHIEKRRSEGYESIQEWLGADEGKSFYSLKHVKNNEDVASLIEEQYNQYTQKFVDGVNLAVELFKKYGISYRLYCIDIYDDYPGTLVMGWNIDNKEYNFVIVGNINEGPYYKVGIMSGGEIHMGSPNTSYEFSEPLPEWFVSGLKRNYC